MEKIENKNKAEAPVTNDTTYIKLGLLVIVLVFGVIGVWSATAKMDSGVPMSGQVVVESSKKIIQHLEGGIVEKIYIKDGDTVKKDDPLVRLDDTQAQSRLDSLKAQYYEALVKYARLTAQDADQEQIIFPAQLDDPKNAKIKQRQIEIFETTKSSLANEEKSAKQKIEAANEQINSLNQTIQSKTKLLESFAEEAKEQQDLYDQRLLDKTKLREITRKIESLESEIYTTKADISRLYIQIRETKTQLTLKQEEFTTQVKKELSDVQTSIKDLKSRIIEITDRLSRSLIKAPVDGTILNLQVHTIGAVISPAKPILEIVPKDSKLIIEAMLSPEYIDYVKVGLKANMTFPAFKLKSSFIRNIQGEVIFVAADSTTDNKGNSFYTIKLIVDEQGLETLRDEKLVLQAGMPVGAVVKIGKQTMLSYLVRPFSVMLNRAFLEE